MYKNVLSKRSLSACDHQQDCLTITSPIPRSELIRYLFHQQYTSRRVASIMCKGQLAANGWQHFTILHPMQWDYNQTIHFTEKKDNELHLLHPAISRTQEYNLPTTQLSSRVQIKYWALNKRDRLPNPFPPISRSKQLARNTTFQVHNTFFWCAFLCHPIPCQLFKRLDQFLSPFTEKLVAHSYMPFAMVAQQA